MSQNLVDLHCHILPGIDDGAKNLDVSIALLNKEIQDGVAGIVFTPHFHYERISVEDFAAKRKAAFLKVAKAAQENGLPLAAKMGAEVYFTTALPSLDLSVLAFAKSNYILIEFPTTCHPAGIDETLYGVRQRGYTPILAHVERYPFVAEDPTLLYNWVSEGCLAQINASGLLREGRFRLYTLALALSLLCNYYLSFFCCIFVGLSFFVWCICRWDGWKRFFRRFCRIALCTLLGVGMASVLLLPTLYGLQNTHSAGNKAPELLALNIAEDASGKAAEGQSTLDLLKEQTLPGLAYGARRVLANLLTSTEPTKMEGLPNVYCGFAAVALAVFFLCCKKVRLREKLLSVGLLAFFLLSFLFRTLDYYWHGGHFPNMLPYRFSFLFSFVLIVMAYRAWTLLDCFRKRYLFVILPVCLGIILCGLGLEGSMRRMLLSALALALVCLALVLYRPERRRQLLSMALLFAVIGAEMVCSIAMGVAKVSLTSRSSYPRESEDVQAVLQAVPEGSGRVEVTSYQTLNDAALNGYRGISIFTSSANVRFNRFSRSLGLASWPASNRYLYYESSPFTNLMCGLEYLIDRDSLQRDTSYTTVAAQSGNVLLLRSRAYLGLGFVADSALGSFVAEQNVYNPIKEQEEMFRMATGLDDALYTHLKYDTLEAPGFGFSFLISSCRVSTCVS
ncbi:MAG: hypothetical protein EGR85_02990, partial [Subdoligranulum sp.]|nr:hypothetical protein [Subdoligranulum sp.]